jgi:hypothetical protein
VTLLSLAVSASATEWQQLGPRALAMGGAGVALPQGAQSAYWNPAQLGLSDNPSGVQIPIGAHMGITGPVLKGANDLNDLGKKCPGAGCSDSDVQNALNELNAPNDGIRGDLGTGAGFKMGRASVFVNNFAWVGAKPIIDMAHNTAANLNQNTSQLRLTGIDVTEFGVAYGHEIPHVPGLNAGLALKGMVGRVGFYGQTVVDEDLAFDKFTKNTKDSFQPGVDLGLLWDVNHTLTNAVWKPRIGFSARNINNPRFKNTDAAIAAGLPSKYSIQGGLRMGVAVSPLHFWNIAADADLTKNLTAVEGVKSQQVGLGTEVNVFNRSWLNIPLRVGLAKNIADSGSKTALSGGLGFNFIHVNLDVGAQVSPGRVETQSQGKSQKLPTETSVSAQLALLFGGQASTPAQ